MATYCRHPYIQLRARSSVSPRSGGSILQSKAGPFLASGEANGRIHKRVGSTQNIFHAEVKLSPETFIPTCMECLRAAMNS